MTLMNGLSICFVIIWMSEINAYSTEKGNMEVYVTNSSSTYSNILSTCKLYGSDYSGELNGNISINITYTGGVWIRAGIGFRRHLNPIGAMYSCAENYTNGITLDQCTSMCTTKYMRHNLKSCHCVDSNKYDESLAYVQPCDGSVCFPGKCVLYEKDVPFKSLRCGTYKFQNIWVYETEECKAKLPYICENGNNNNTSSWFGAHHYCKQQNSNLLQENSAIPDSYKDGRKYWISPFRQQVFLWQYDSVDSLCVAGNLTDDGILIPFIDFCNRTFPALCSVQNNDKPEQTNSEHTTLKGMVIGVVSVSVVIFIVIVIVVTVKKMK